MSARRKLNTAYFGVETLTEVEHALEKFDAGTPNYADSIALAVAVDYLENLGMANVRAHEVDVAGYALERLTGRELAASAARAQFDGEARP